MTSRQVRRAAERAARKQARKAARAASPSPTTTTSEARAASEARTDVNRANAQHSTGPKTPEGKSNSSRNSFKHGLYSKQLVLSTEEATALDALKADLRREHQPANTAEEILVNEMAEQFWRIRRARALEVTVLEDNHHLSHLAAVQRMMSSAERGFHKALTTLRQLQKDRGAENSDGFVSQNAVAEPAELDQTGFVSQNAVAESQNTASGSLAGDTELCFSVESDQAGFVPPICPDDVDPWEWARVHDPEVYELYLEDKAVLDSLIARGKVQTSQSAA